jgi:putative hydrolase of the HAD superfamily
MILPRALLLDLDDTILDDSGCGEECWAEAAIEVETLVPGLTADVLQLAIQEYASWWWSDPERNRRGRLELRSATAEVVRGSLDRLGFKNQDAAVMIANKYRDLKEERARLHDGALETLEWARSQGILLGLMTNGAGSAQRLKIERFGLEPFFGHMVIEGEYGYGKPDPRVYQGLMDALNVGPSDTWAVGDNLEADVRGAMRAGIHGVWVDRHDRGITDDGPRPDRVIRELRDLLNHLG